MLRIVVIPTRNEEATIAASIAQISQYGVIVADGNSTDRTRQIAAESGANVVFSRGKTYGDAVLSGLQVALDMGATEIIVMDSESHRFSEIQPHLDGDWDVLSGKRKKEYKSITRRLISMVGRFYRWLYIEVPITDPSNGFRAYKAHVVADLLKMYDGVVIPSYAFNFAVAAHLKMLGKLEIREFPMTYVGGKTGLNAKELLKAAIWIRRNCLA